MATKPTKKFIKKMNYYPNVITRGAPSINKENMDAVLKHIWPSADMVDLGCNAGWLIEEMAKRGYHMVGVDLADLAVKEAIRKKLTVHKRPIEDTGLAENYFGTVTCMSVLEQVENIGAVIDEVDRLLKPGGWFIGINPTPNGDWGVKAIGNNPYVLNVLPPDKFALALKIWFNGNPYIEKVTDHSYLFKVRKNEISEKTRE